MADPNLAAIFAGLDPLSAQILQGQQGAQLGAAALDPAFGHNEGIAGALAKTIAGFSGHDMMNQAVQNTTQARIAAQPGIAQLIANPNAYAELAQNPQNYSPLVRAAFLAGGPEQAQKYQMGQQEITAGALKNLAALSQVRGQAAALGGSMPSGQDVTSGVYQGPNWPRVFNSGGGGAAPASAPPSAGAASVVQPVTATLTKLGYSPIDQAAVLGNAAWESSLNPANTSGDKGSSIGLWQWHSPDRQAGLRKYAADAGQNWTDPSVQAGYMDQELRHRAPEFFDPNKTLAEKTKIFQDKFEVPAADTSKQRTQLAQNFAGQTSDAGAGSGAAPGQASSLGDTYKQQAVLNVLGIKSPEAIQDYLAAQVMPQGQGRTLALSAALNKAGLKPFIGGERRGSPIFQLDPETMQYHLAVQNPQLPEGAIESPGGAISMAPGALPAIAGVEKAKAGAEAEAKAPYEEPIQIHGPQGENWLLPRALAPMLPYLAQAGVRVGTPPGIAAPGAGTAPLGGPAPPAGAPPIPPAGAPPLSPPGAPPVSGGLMRGGAVPGPQVPGVPPPPLAPGARPPTPGSAMGASPMPVAAAGGKDISQLTLDDLFPGGQGISQRPQPPPGAMPGPLTEAEKDVQKRDVERLSEYQNQTIPNQEIYRDAGHIMDTLAEGLHTSNLTPLTYRLTNMMQGLGMDPEKVLGRGYNPADTAVFDKAATNLVSAFVRRFAGQIRVAEFGIGERANPGLTMPIQANYSIINDVIARSRWQDAFTNLATKYSTETGHAPLNTFEHRFAQVAPLPQYTDASKAALRQMGAKFPEDAGTARPAEGSATQPPPAAANRRSRYDPAAGRIVPQ